MCRNYNQFKLTLLWKNKSTTIFEQVIISCWIFFNDSETVTAITLAFCRIKKFFIGNIRVKIGIPKSLLFPDIGQKWEGGTSDFQISVQSIIKKNFHNFRISNDIDMRLEPVTKLDRRNKTTSKKSDNNIMSINCGVIVTYLIYNQFGAIRKSGFGSLLCKTYT